MKDRLRMTMWWGEKAEGVVNGNDEGPGVGLAVVAAACADSDYEDPDEGFDDFYESEEDKILDEQIVKSLI